MTKDLVPTVGADRPPDTLVMLGSQGPGVGPQARLAVLSELQMRLFGRAKVELGRYEVVQTIGRGAFGVVFRVHDPELQRDVAAKVLIRTSSTSAPLVTEARAVARLNHPNVVAVHDVGRCDASVLGDDSVGEGVFIVMELVDGPSMAQWLRAGRSPAEILEAFRQAGEGLAAAHGAGLIHRDFKPANVLINARGVAKVADFGLATELTVDGDTPLGGEGRYLAGTPPYIAPETLEGVPASEHSDQYAYCVALREALSGAPVFDAPTMGELWVLKQTMPPWGSAEGISRSLRRVIERGMAVDPKQRWPDMAALLAALDATGPRRRAWWTVAGLVLAVVVLVGAGVAWAVGLEPAAPGLAGAEASAPVSATGPAVGSSSAPPSGPSPAASSGADGPASDGAPTKEPDASPPGAAMADLGSDPSSASGEAPQERPVDSRSAWAGRRGSPRRRSGQGGARRTAPARSSAKPEQLSTATIGRALSRATADCGRQGGMVSGSVAVGFDVSAQGSIFAVRVREPYTHGPVGRCIAQALEALTLPEAQRGRQYRGTVTLGGSAGARDSAEG